MMVGKKYKYKYNNLSNLEHTCLYLTPQGGAIFLHGLSGKEFFVEKDCIHFYEEVKEKLKGTKWLVIGTPNPVRSPPFISYVSFNTREEAESWIKITRHFTIFAIKEVQWEEGEGL